MTEATRELRVSDGEIPLPPQDMWGALDNSPGAGASEPATPTQIGASVAALEFIGERKPFKAISLVYPFRWNGVEVTEIVVHRLTVSQIGAFWDGLPDDGRYERTDVYGLMCALPGSVIRALPDPDGTEVTAICFDFLPRALGGPAV